MYLSFKYSLKDMGIVVILLMVGTPSVLHGIEAYEVFIILR